MRQPIPLHRSIVTDDELTNVADALRSGATGAGGPWSDRVRDLLRAELGATEVLLTTSCTSALELAAQVLDLGPDDTVIVPSFTFPSTAAAFLRAGAQVRFCDIERSTLGMDPAALDAMMDDRVAAVVVVHYAGLPCDLGGIASVLDQWPRALLIEDNAHGLFGGWAGRPLGSIGALSTLSFHQTKTFSCGEGGALVLGPDIDRERAWTLWDKGTDRRAFLAGRTAAYTWQAIGSSFGLADVLAAVLAAQLDEREAWIGHRRRAAGRYVEMLGPHADELGVTLFPALAGTDSAAHLFPVLLPPSCARAEVIDGLAARGVQTAFHYLPLHRSPAGARADPTSSCPVTDDVATRLLRLPLHSSLTDPDVQVVAEALIKVLRTSAGSS